MTTGCADGEGCYPNLVTGRSACYTPADCPESSTGAPQCATDPGTQGCACEYISCCRPGRMAVRLPSILLVLGLVGCAIDGDDTGSGTEELSACNAVAGTGCTYGEKCTYLLIGERTDCAPAGPVVLDPRRHPLHH